MKNKAYKGPSVRKGEAIYPIAKLHANHFKLTEIGVFDEDRIVTFEDTIRRMTGQRAHSFSAFRRSNFAQEQIERQTERLAGLLEARGIKARIEDGSKLFIRTHVTNIIREVPKYRNINFLPQVAQRNRREMLKDLEYHLASKLEFKHARYLVITAGHRVPFDRAKDSLRKHIQDFKKKLQRWRNDICAPHGVSVLFQGIEFTRSDNKTYHVHANVVILPPEEMLAPSGPDYTSFFVASQNFLPHLHDCDQIKTLHGFVKYPFKPAELEAICGDEAEWIYHNTYKLRMFENLGSFGEFCRRRKERKLRVVKIGDELHLRSGCNPSGDPQAKKDLRDARNPGKRRSNLFLTVLEPGLYATPWKEAATLFLNLDQSRLHEAQREIREDEHFRKISLEAWRASEAPSPEAAVATTERILGGDPDDPEKFEQVPRNPGNVHYTTITSESSDQVLHSIPQKSSDPSSSTGEPLCGSEHSDRAIISNSATTGYDDLMANLIHIFDCEPDHGQVFHFRDSLLPRDKLERVLEALAPVRKSALRNLTSATSNGNAR